MKRTYREHIPERRDRKDLVSAHIVDYEYDTEDIKDKCCICGRGIEINEERYKKRGNYCEKCNTGKVKNRYKSIKNQ